MTSNSSKSTYTQGHSAAILKSHQSRTIHNSAAFLLPHLQPHFHLLDIGCGPGTITAGFATRLKDGSVTGIDIGPEVISHDKTTYSTGANPNLTFEVGNVLNGLRFDDNSFDVIFTNQTMIHLPDPIKAIKEMHRILKPGGLLAMRESDRQDWYPESEGLLLYNDAMQKMMNSTGAKGWYSTRGMHGWAREAGFDRDKMTVSGSGSVSCSKPEREFLADVHLSRLRDAVGAKIMELGLVDQKQVDRIIQDVEKWRDDVDGWNVIWQCELIARK
jgi:ubiquinone/menaquinone biosynthesis C-methylase UbiE